MGLSCEWNAKKAGEKDAVESITMGDPDHSLDEQRFVDIGTSERGRVLVVSYTQRGGSIRIISCRGATAKERRRYEEGIIR